MMANASSLEKSARLRSLDAFRGFVMLAMCSGGFALTSVVDNYIDPEVLVATAPPTEAASTSRQPGAEAAQQPNGASEAPKADGKSAAAKKAEESTWATIRLGLWHLLAHQFSHTRWEGCTFWDLIQPAFMFMVGAAMPFSYARRRAEGHSATRMLNHAATRSVILILLGLLIVSNSKSQTNFSFVNVLTQIGLGYMFAYLFLGRHVAIQLVGVVVILGGYWYYFYSYTIPQSQHELLASYFKEVAHKGQIDPPVELGYLDEVRDAWKNMAEHWGKHTNAAAAFDRKFLNYFPSAEPEWRGRRYWANLGGYQTLNFIPSIVTMILGMLAGQLLAGPRSNTQKLRLLLAAGLVCLLLAIAADTTIWQFFFPGFWDRWVVCPIVKRIWTPSWTLFSGGWVLLMLAMFFYFIEIRGHKRCSFLFEVVGLNSLMTYLVYQFSRGWILKTWQIHLRTLDSWFTCLFKWTGSWMESLKNVDSRLADEFFNSRFNPYAGILQSILVLVTLWLMCYWLYRRKIFIRA